MYIKYEVSMSNHVPGGGECAQTMTMPTLMQDDANDEAGQSMIVKVLWLINQMSQKNLEILILVKVFTDPFYRQSYLKGPRPSFVK